MSIELLKEKLKPIFSFLDDMNFDYSEREITDLIDKIKSESNITKCLDCNKLDICGRWVMQYPSWGQEQPSDIVEYCSLAHKKEKK